MVYTYRNNDTLDPKWAVIDAYQERIVQLTSNHVKWSTDDTKVKIKRDAIGRSMNEHYLSPASTTGLRPSRPCQG